MMSGDFRKMKRPKAGADFRWGILSWRVETALPGSKATREELLAEAISTLREKRAWLGTVFSCAAGEGT